MKSKRDTPYVYTSCNMDHDQIPVVKLPIDGSLDLHTFNPKEISSLIPEYIEECLEAGILEVRIIHGKGKGILKRSVHAILSRLETVESFHLAPPDRGHYGATIVRLVKGR